MRAGRHKTPLLGRASRQPTRSLLPSKDDAARMRHNVSAREDPLPAGTIASPKAGRCGKEAAQRLGLGGFDGFEKKTRLIPAKRPGLGEKRPRKIPARESRREGPSRLPAGTSEPFSARKGGSLPRRDVVQTRASFGARKAEILPSKDDAPKARRNFPAWKSPPPTSTSASPKAGRCGARPAQRPCLGELSGFEKRIRTFLAQRPGLGEKRPRKIPARERRRGGPGRLPAGTSETFSARKGGSLPRRDLAPKRSRLRASEAGFLPSKDDAPRARHNVPAWENRGQAGTQTAPALKPTHTPTPDTELANLTECLPLPYAPPAGP